jgi:diadenosine tetraphosphate (Ap4A) HIT family hydrolase
MSAPRWEAFARLVVGKLQPLQKFTLAPAFLGASAPLCELKLCTARLQADARWPWIVLIPRKAGVMELEHLSAADRHQLIEETVLAGAAARAIGAALGRPVEKLNVGQIGNITPQLHVHVVGRRSDDPAWPGPVWGVGEARAYVPEALAAAVQAAEMTLARFKIAS